MGGNTDGPRVRCPLSSGRGKPRGQIVWGLQSVEWRGGNRAASPYVARRRKLAHPYTDYSNAFGMVVCNNKNTILAVEVMTST